MSGGDVTKSAPPAAAETLARPWHAHSEEGAAGGRARHSVCCGSSAAEGGDAPHVCVAWAFGRDEADATAVAERIAADHNAAIGVPGPTRGRPPAGAQAAVDVDVDGTLLEAVEALRAMQWDGGGGDGTADLVARLGRAAVAVRDEREALRWALARVVRYEVGQTHAHGRVGVWDASNRAEIAGEPCARCHDFADAREALGLDRWPSAARRERDADEAPRVCAHRRGCGCGGPAYREGPVVSVDSADVLLGAVEALLARKDGR